MKNIISYQEIAECEGCRKTTEVTTYQTINNKNETLSLCIYCKKTYRRQNLHAKRRSISDMQYKKLYIKQGGVCAVCKQPETTKGPGGRISPLSIDHDHTTGAIRGLLCRMCNAALGMLKEDVERCEALVRYIKENQNS